MASDSVERTTFDALVQSGILEIGDGYRAKNDELGGTGIIFLRAGHVTDTHVDFTGADRFHEGALPRLRPKMSMPGDAVVTTKGNSTGRTTFVTADMPPFVYSPHLSYWRSKNPEVLNSCFLRYWSRSAEFRRQLAGMMVSTDMAPYLSLADQRRLTISVPPIGAQRAIAHILGTLDDKIELNRRMSETLESMARALFKSWFVDFDPVRAKAEGRDPGLPDAIASLFPARLMGAELGEIPEGWRVADVCTIADVIYGAPFASALFNSTESGVPLIRIRDLASEEPGVWTTEEHPKGYKIKPGDIVVGMDGEFRAYLWGGTEAWLNQRVCAFRQKPGYSAAFVRNAIIGPLARVEATETATTVIHLGKADIDQFRVVLPTSPIAARFNSICQPCYERIVTTKQESRNLAALRDALLPKLISGELSLRDAERFLAREGVPV